MCKSCADTRHTGKICRYMTRRYKDEKYKDKKYTDERYKDNRHTGKRYSGKIYTTDKTRTRNGYQSPFP